MTNMHEKKALIDEATQFLHELEEVEKRTKISQMQTKDKREGTANKVAALILVVALIFGGFLAYKFISWLSSPTDEEDYVTYYQDDNGNGELDQGEWNYTEDEDGNVVDVDDDLSNFE